MARILCFDTATKSCTVGVSIDGRAEAIVESLDEGYSHSEKLHGYIEEAMKQANLKMADLDAVAVGKGPGSYTGLRIGVSSAKGFAYALNIPIISIDTLQAMAAQCSEQIGNDDLLAPMLDARRMEVYTAFYNKRLESVTDISAEIIDEESYSTALQKQVIHFFGNWRRRSFSLVNSKTRPTLSLSISKSSWRRCLRSYSNPGL